MRKLFVILGLAGMLFAGLGLSANPSKMKTMSWIGWISDSGCAAKGTNAMHKDCGIKCVTEKGAAWVFVNSKTKKVYAIHNQDAVNKDTDLGQEVKLTGHAMEDGSLHVESIAPVK